MAVATLALLVHRPIWQPAQLHSVCTFASEHAAVWVHRLFCWAAPRWSPFPRFVNGSPDQAPELLPGAIASEGFFRHE
jgi:hypothetical protein